MTKAILSGSSDGALIQVAAKSSPGTVIHTATSSVGLGDAVTILAANNEAIDRDLTLEWGTKKFVVKLPAKSGFVTILDAALIRAGLVIKAYSNGGSIIVQGWVDDEPAAPTITITGTLPGGTHSVAYGSHTLAGAGGTGPYTFSLLSGSLPTGMTLNASTGVVSGTPGSGTAGTYDFTVRATSAVVDNTQYVGDQAFEVVIA